MIAISYKFPSIFPFVKGYNCSGSDNYIRKNVEAKILGWIPNKVKRGQIWPSYIPMELSWDGFQDCSIYWISWLETCFQDVKKISWPHHFQVFSVCVFFCGFYKWENIDFDMILGL